MQILALVCSMLLTSFGAIATSVAFESGHVSGNEEIIAVEHAEILPAPPASEIMNGYLTIWNGTATPIVITELNSPKFGSIRVHRTEVIDDYARVRPFAGPLTIPPRAELLMKPGGIHLTLSAKKTQLKPGDRVPIALVLSSGSIIAASAVVRAFGSERFDHHHAGKDASDRY